MFYKINLIFKTVRNVLKQYKTIFYSSNAHWKRRRDFLYLKKLAMKLKNHIPFHLKNKHKRHTNQTQLNSKQKKYYIKGTKQI